MTTSQGNESDGWHSSPTRIVIRHALAAVEVEQLLPLSVLERLGARCMPKRASHRDVYSSHVILALADESAVGFVAYTGSCRDRPPPCRNDHESTSPTRMLDLLKGFIQMARTIEFGDSKGRHGSSRMTARDVLISRMYSDQGSPLFTLLNGPRDDVEELWIVSAEGKASLTVHPFTEAVDAALTWAGESGGEIYRVNRPGTEPELYKAAW